MASPDILSNRSSGVLLHLTSLPGPHGSGDLGPAAYRFVDFLAAAGQRWWQMLPVSPAGGGNSPYQSPSAMAGSPILVSLEDLRRQRLLTAADVAPLRGARPDRVDFAAVIEYRETRLRRAYERFTAAPPRGERAAFEQFCRRNAAWLDHHALFSALKDVNANKPWTEWPAPVRDRRHGALLGLSRALADSIRFHQFVQYQFRRQWDALRAYGRERGVGLIGDIPIYVSHDSADVWAYRTLFELDAKGRPAQVGGVPPDHFSKTGQLWGNPLYRWHRMLNRGFDWWISRFEANYELFDVARIDHFIGFHRYWSVPGAHKTAERGKWLPGPDDKFFNAIRRHFGVLPIIAEDVGAVTDGVIALRDKFGLPGLKILQYAFGGRGNGNSPNLPHSFPRRCAVYTGTHDNDTTVGWFKGVQARARARGKVGVKARHELVTIKRYLDTDGREINWDLIRAALASVADTALFPVQDLLGLDTSGRMNLPGTGEGNWAWRMREGALTEKIGERLRDLTQTYGRAPASA